MSGEYTETIEDMEGAYLRFSHNDRNSRANEKIRQMMRTKFGYFSSIKALALGMLNDGVTHFYGGHVVY